MPPLAFIKNYSILQAGSLCSLLLITCFSIAKTETLNHKKLAKQLWLQVTTDNFVIVTDLKASEAEFIAKDLENFRDFSLKVMQLEPLKNLPPLPVLAVSDIKTFKLLTLPSNIGGVFSRGPFEVSAIANVFQYRPGTENENHARQILLHEYIHFLLRHTKNQMDIPSWYEEGIAEYWATFKLVDGIVEIGNSSVISYRIYDLYSDSFGKNLIDSEKLFTNPIPSLVDSSENGKRALSNYYARAYFTVHYLNSHPKLRAGVRRYIELVNDGMEPKKAFSEVFNVSFQDFDNIVLDYLSKDSAMQIRTFSAKEGEFKFPSVASNVRKLNKAEKYETLAKHFWLNGLVRMGFDDRKKLLEEAIKLNPENSELELYLELLTKELKDYEWPLQK